MERGTFREILVAAMSEENVDRYRRVVEAFARRDLDAFLELFDPDVDVAPRSAELEGSSYRGHEGIRSWWETMFRLFSEYRAEIQEVQDLGDVTFGWLRLRPGNGKRRAHGADAVARRRMATGNGHPLAHAPERGRSPRSRRDVGVAAMDENR